jgi:serine/threonine-protein kinase RsbT
VERAARGTMEAEVRVRIQSLADIVVARQQGRALAAQLGFSNSHLTIIATAISESARNIVEYATEGEVIVTLVNKGDSRGIEVMVIDHGPGIADLATVLQDGHPTRPGLGMGLRGSRRLMDEFEIASEVGKGTIVTMKKWVV